MPEGYRGGVAPALWLCFDAHGLWSFPFYVLYYFYILLSCFMAFYVGTCLSADGVPRLRGSGLALGAGTWWTLQLSHPESGCLHLHARQGRTSVKLLPLKTSNYKRWCIWMHLDWLTLIPEVSKEIWSSRCCRICDEWNEFADWHQNDHQGAQCCWGSFRSGRCSARRCTDRRPLGRTA